MTKKLDLKVNLDAELIAREVPTQRVIELVVTPPDAREVQQRPVLNLALVIDRSGSMSGEKLEYVKQAANHVIDLLKDDDRVAVVAYDTDVTLISGSVAVTPSARAELRAAISAIRSGNMTNLSGGWLKGCEQVASALKEGGINRVLLLTDGMANVGITGLEELGHHASELLSRGVATSTFGVGLDFNEHLLEHMANQGGGRFYYIPSPGEIPGIFARELKEIAAVTARRVEVVLTIPAGVSAQVLGSWRSEQVNDQLHIWLGDIAGGHRREIYVKLLTPPSGDLEGLKIRVTVTAMGETNDVLTVENHVDLKYALLNQVQSTPVKRDIMERFSKVDIADKVTEALKLERAGERDKASSLLNTELQAAAPYLPVENVQEYQRLSQRMREGLDEASRKESHQDAYNIKKLNRRD